MRKTKKGENILDAWDYLTAAIVGPVGSYEYAQCYKHTDLASKLWQEGIADNEELDKEHMQWNPEAKPRRIPIEWKQVAYHMDAWKWAGEQLRKSDKALEPESVEAAVRLSLKKSRGWKSSPPETIEFAKEIQRLLNEAPNPSPVPMRK